MGMTTLPMQIELSRSSAELLEAMAGLISAIDHGDEVMLGEDVVKASKRLREALSDPQAFTATALDPEGQFIDVDAHNAELYGMAMATKTYHDWVVARYRAALVAVAVGAAALGYFFGQ